MEYSSDIEDFKTMYEYLMSRIYSNPNYTLKLTSKTTTLIKKLLKTLSLKSNESIWQYLLFTVVLNDNKLANSKSLTLSNQCSTTKILRWKNRTSKQMFLVAKFSKERGYKNPLKKESVLSERYLNDLRNKNKGTVKGYIVCQEYDLFDDFECSDCNYFETCKKNV